MSSPDITEGWIRAERNEPHTYRTRVPRQANCMYLATSWVRIKKYQGFQINHIYLLAIGYTKDYNKHLTE